MAEWGRRQDEKKAFFFSKAPRPSLPYFRLSLVPPKIIQISNNPGLANRALKDWAQGKKYGSANFILDEPCYTKEMLYAVRCLKSNEDMILALAGQFKQLSHEPEKFR